MTSYNTMCRAKLHNATVTETKLQYEGSITVDQNLLDAAGMHLYEKVHVVNLNNGERFETYIIPGDRDTGEVCLNGPAARLAEVGDTVIVIAYSLVPESDAPTFRPTIVVLGPQNQLREVVRPV
jgi:aspartate 1-decarboxylase